LLTDNIGALHFPSLLTHPQTSPLASLHLPHRPHLRAPQGLEDQLLALVVNHERPDLQEQAAALVSTLGQYTITLKELEDSLLARLANAQVCTWRLRCLLEIRLDCSDCSRHSLKDCCTSTTH